MSENYTVKQEAALTEAAPVTYAQAVEFGKEFGKSTRSVIAKVLSLDLDYVAKPVEPKRPRGATKAELVAEIAAAVGLDKAELAGLDKATGVSLAKLLAFV